jgi:orotate phosphoribosyltransferase
LIRTGKAIQETADLIQELGGEIIGCGAIVRFEDAPAEVNGIKILSLAQFDCNFYETEEEWKAAEGSDVPAETVRF